MFTLVIILLVLMTVSIASVWILLGENWCRSPLGLNPFGPKSDQHQYYFLLTTSADHQE